jgi:hypothetical protein
MTMNFQQRECALAEMRLLASAFYARAAKIGVHPFIEFSGLMNEYIKACEGAHEKGVDFTDCNAHTGKQLPMESFMVDYVNQKLECIFSGRSAMSLTRSEL